LAHEFVADQKNTQHTMDTMVSHPYVNHIPTLVGGIGYEELSHFYEHHFIFQNPDIEIIPVSRTIGMDQLVDEMILKLKHTKHVDWLLPGVEPTNKDLEFPLVAIVRFANEDGEWHVAHEHVYWDQATLLVQLGLLDPKGLPVSGKEQAHKVKDPASVPSNDLLKNTGRYLHRKEDL